jgi:hypothetical protein
MQVLSSVLDAVAGMPHHAQGVIPRCSAAGASTSYSSASEPDQHSGAVHNYMPTLPELHADQSAVQQAAKLVDCMDLGATSTTNIISSKTMRRGWTRQGGDFAPRVNIPWPQDFILGTGRNNRVTYDDLDVLQWSQGCISIIEKEENPETQRSMLLTLRNTLRDSQFHGFEGARFSYGALLSVSALYHRMVLGEHRLPV